MGKKKDSISIIITALNEENNLVSSYNKVKSIVKKYFRKYEFIIINDGSSDKTGEIADELKSIAFGSKNQ